ncbi:MAG: elongation factor P [Pseudomonadales bacterium]|nr:elongation factor P [Candidatus Woesebacteria bacterium]MCB9800678.1 elongation factor P [Pseudomonadales bacterium]
MSTLKAGNIRKGMYLIHKEQPYYVTHTDFMSPGKGSAFMRVRYRNVITGNTEEFTYKSNESVEEADVVSKQMQFLYVDGSDYVFMDNGTYEQVEIAADLIEEKAGLLTPDIQVYVLFYNGKAIGVSFPPKVRLKVTYAEEATAGNTQGQARKMVTLETGMEISAPIFVKEGDTLVIDTDTISYVSRAN